MRKLPAQTGVTSTGVVSVKDSRRAKKDTKGNLMGGYGGERNTKVVAVYTFTAGVSEKQKSWGTKSEDQWEAGIEV